MTPIRKDKNDTKLLLAVAGLVVAGVAGIALLAGLSADRAERKRAARQEPAAASARDQPARPAMFPVQTEPAVTTEPSFEPVEPGAPVFDIDPNDDLVARATEAYKAREYDRSAAYWTAEIDARPQRAWSHYMLGLSLWKADRLDEAVAAMQQAAKLEPTSIKSFVNLSRIHNDRGEPAEALEAATAAQALDESDPTALFLLGRSLMNLGRLDEAIEALYASLGFDPDNGYVQNMLGLSLIQQGRFDEAVEPLRLAAELEPQVAYIQNNLGLALERTDQRDSAIAAFRRALEIDADHARAAANLARLESSEEPGVGEPPTVDIATEQPEAADEVVVADSGATH